MTDHGSSPAASDGGSPTFPVEDERRFSRSLLFRLQRAFFDRRGVEAWRTTIVPHYVTNNPRLARAYAEVFLGWLRDCAAGPRDEGRPVTIVEIGAGCGRFGYLFLRALEELHRRSSVSHVRFRYVMTDFTESNVQFWRAHEGLRPFVARGLLDFALFDAEQGTSIRLLESGEILAPGGVKGRLGVIANYVLDGLSQDAFSCEGGLLHEWLVSLSARAPVTDLDDPELLARLEVVYRRQPAPPDYYGEPVLDAVLRGYERTMEGRTVFFPHAAIRCLARLSEIGEDGLFLLSGDRGSIDPEAVGTPGEPSFSLHGSFSTDVDYHAVAAYVRGRGGVVLEPGHRSANLGTFGFLLGPEGVSHRETTLAFDQAISRGGPDDFYTARVGVQDHYDALDLEQLLAMIRLSQHDPRILRDCLPSLVARAAGAGEGQRRGVTRAAARVWENDYFIGEEQDLAFDLAHLCHAFGAWREALPFLAASVRRFGARASTSWNLGLCHYALGETEDALRCFAEAARLQPGFSPEGAFQVT